MKIANLFNPKCEQEKLRLIGIGLIILLSTFWSIWYYFVYPSQEFIELCKSSGKLENINCRIFIFIVGIIFGPIITLLAFALLFELIIRVIVTIIGFFEYFFVNSDVPFYDNLGEKWYGKHNHDCRCYACRGY